MTMRQVGRPRIGNPVHVRLGNLLTEIDQFRSDHGYSQNQRPDAIRELIKRGLAASAGERVLFSIYRKACYRPGTHQETVGRYVAAINNGVIATAEMSEDQSVGVRLIRYVDPLDETTRWLVAVLGETYYRDLVDYTDRVRAEETYYETVQRWVG